MDIGYIRVSKGSESKENQEEAILKYFKLKRSEIKFFYDIISGESPPMERPGFIDMTDFMSKDGPGKVYTYEISRLGRDHNETGYLISNIEKKFPRKIFSASPVESWMNIEDPGIRSLVISIFAWHADQELKKLKQRTKDALDRKKKELEENGHFISNSGKRIEKLGRPEREIDWKTVNEYREKKVSYTAICKILDYNYGWFLRKKKEMETPTPTEILKKNVERKWET